ncbi:AraC-like DNA-binding protein [Streptomyces sp. SAI-208]|uniref:AraC family transcriptional regulator n=1 Tax=Streptomyces sp. SAI-208 TaxID=2940550 RepID=UPI002475C0CB|nr:AraC family transcriptional regulator [Streptomyces sp. SAI-208]MDH6604652.1 AraC-like DNA-binding protein [Streptomyces sp. SAI-208]
MSSMIFHRSSSALVPSDPVADRIGLLRPRTEAHPGLHAAAPWAVQFDAFEFVKIGCAVRGACWLLVEGSEPLYLQEGDFYLLKSPGPHVLASSPTVTPRPGRELLESASRGVARIGAEADETNYVCMASLWFDEANAPLLLEILPPLVHLPATNPLIRQVAYITELLGIEVESRAVGRSLVLDHLAQIMFVQVLRAHVAQTDQPAGWLGALNHEGIGAALRAMHADVAHRWTLRELAAISHLSRSAFAAKFKKEVGAAPLEYLIQWRMSLARDALRRDTRSISELAFATGYESESAFSTAFRRVVGVSPRQFRDSARRAAGASTEREDQSPQKPEQAITSGFLPEAVPQRITERMDRTEFLVG